MSDDAFLRAISDPERVVAQIVEVARRARGRRLASLAQDGVAFAAIVAEREEVAPRLAAALADGSYRPAPVVVTRARLAGKDRDIARLPALDLVAHGVVARALASRLEPTLSRALWSYRRGRSAWHALRALGAVARAHRRAVPDVRARGLFVLRADVKSYTDEIPLEDDAPLWPMIEEVSGLRRGDPGWAMLRALLRARVREADGSERERDRGLLFGAPTTTVVANLYLRELDAKLAARPHSAYARFGDDLVFVARDPGAVREAKEETTRLLARLGLTLNESKVRCLAWNGAARPSPAWPEATPVDRVAFLGAEVAFDGTIRLPTRKWRHALRDVRGRILRTASLLEGAPEERARVLAQVTTEALDPGSELATPASVALLRLVDDRAQLAELDHLLALWIAEAATGERGPRAFRRLPPRWLRAEAGLVSRVVLRNGG